MPKTIADTLEMNDPPVEFWRALALGLLRRVEAREPGFTSAAGVSILLAAETAEMLLLRKDHLDEIPDIVKPPKVDTPDEGPARYQNLIRRLGDQLELELSSLKVDRRRLKPDLCPIPKHMLGVQYLWVRFWVQSLREIIKQRGIGEAARAIWRIYGLEHTGTSLKECLGRAQRDRKFFWRFALLYGVILKNDLAFPDDETMEAMIQACESEKTTSAEAALEILEMICTIKDPKTGKERYKLSAAKIKQEIAKRDGVGRTAREVRIRSAQRKLFPELQAK